MTLEISIGIPEEIEGPNLIGLPVTAVPSALTLFEEETAVVCHRGAPCLRARVPGDQPASAGEVTQKNVRPEGQAGMLAVAQRYRRGNT